MQCEIIEAHVEDAVGYPCSNDASSQCCDCGAHLCDVHGTHCNVCDGLICDTCLAFHIRAAHQRKESAPESEYRKAA